MRDVCVLTGTRAEYGLLKPVMNAIREHSNLELSLIVTGMHLSEEFGYSVDEIITDGFEITERVEMNPEEDTGFSMAQSVGRGIMGISDALRKIKPDILLVLGDRIESLAGVIASAYMNIPVAHIHGGDSAGAGLDESVRHAITKFAHIHFPVTEKSAERILKMGENDWRVYIVGAPCLDTILNTKFLTREEVEKKFDLDLTKPAILLVQHSVTTEPEKAEQQILETLNAIKELKYQTIAICPNSDAGGRSIIKQIKEYGSNHLFIKHYKNLSQSEYLSLLKYVSVMIGNSSSGIIESSSFKLPVVNIGTRQEGRERANNVIDVDYDKDEIKNAIMKALSNEFKEKLRYCRNPYGDGKAGKIVADMLAEIKIDNRLLQKKLIY
jgi:GDP/UDP-N,N'-diacetylbacillosamine 2-epimerase (hydrolysing)